MKFYVGVRKECAVALAKCIEEKFHVVCRVVDEHDYRKSHNLSVPFISDVEKQESLKNRIQLYADAFKAGWYEGGCDALQKR